MVGILFAIACAAGLWGVLAASGQLRPKAPLPRILFAGYVLRLLIQFVIRDVRVFSAASVDSTAYETGAILVAQVWSRTGIHFIDVDELAMFGQTSLPPNLFGLIVYMNGGSPTRLGCTALVALAAALTVLNLYLLALQFGAEKKNALLFAGILYFQPAFLFYTSDLYKDGIVLVFTMGALGSALRLASKVSIVHIAIGALCVWALWYVRFYLVFVTVAPLVVGLVGVGGKSAVRTLIAALVVVVASVVLAGFTDVLELAATRASETFEIGTAAYVRAANADAGSGITFDDDGSPFGALPAKLAYTLLSPFPWAKGSLGFQLGKLDVFIWYFTLYRAIRAAWTVDRRLLLMLATFIVPCTMMYAMSMANVGLIVRQRLVIVAATAILASLYKAPRKSPQRTVRGRARSSPTVRLSLVAVSRPHSHLR